MQQHRWLWCSKDNSTRLTSRERPGHVWSKIKRDDRGKAYSKTEVWSLIVWYYWFVVIAKAGVQFKKNYDDYRFRNDPQKKKMISKTNATRFESKHSVYMYDRPGVISNGGGFPRTTPERRRWLLTTPKGAHARIRYPSCDSLNTTVGGVCMKKSRFRQVIFPRFGFKSKIVIFPGSLWYAFYGPFLSVFKRTSVCPHGRT